MKFQNYPDVKDGKYFLEMKPEWEYLQPVPKDGEAVVRYRVRYSW